MAIHPTAIIDPQAEVDSSAEIGPYVVLDGPVKIGAGTTLRAHAYVSGWTEIGERCEIHPFAVVGHLPQDFHFTGERTFCRVGNDVVIREGATVHRGTQPESATVIGDGCFLMAYSHVGHNCVLGKRVKVYNMSILSGHVEADDDVIISGFSGVHQFVRIGRLAFVAGNARVTMDVPPFFMAFGEATVIQHNIVGMRRAGLDNRTIFEIRQAFRTLYRSGQLFSKAVEQLAAEVQTEAGRQLVEFLRAPTKRGICAGAIHQRRRGRAAGAGSGEA